MWWLLRRRFGHRLYLQIYVTVVASLALVVLAAGVVWHTVQGGVTNEIGTIAGEVAAAALPSEVRGCGGLPRRLMGAKKISVGREQNPLNIQSPETTLNLGAGEYTLWKTGIEFRSHQDQLAKDFRASVAAANTAVDSLPATTEAPGVTDTAAAGGANGFNFRIDLSMQSSQPIDIVPVTPDAVAPVLTALFGRQTARFILQPHKFENFLRAPAHLGGGRANHLGSIGDVLERIFGLQQTKGLENDADRLAQPAARDLAGITPIHKNLAGIRDFFLIDHLE